MNASPLPAAMKPATFPQSAHRLAPVLACALFLAWGAASPVSSAVVGQVLPVPLGINTNGFLGNNGSRITIGGVTYRAFWVASPYGFDVDGNGTTDIIFAGEGRDGGLQAMRAELHGQNQVWSISGGFSGDDLGSYALALLGDTVLGPALTDPNLYVGWHNDDDTKSHSTLARLYGTISGGEFSNDMPFEEHYLGIRFEREGAIHYGWIGLSSLFTGEDILIHQWAWETEPGKAIIVGQIPEPSTAWLGLGAAAGALAWRRRSSSKRV